MTDEEKQLELEDVMWNMLLNDLRRGVVKVLFEKANGTMREMVCTLHPSRITYDFKKVESMADKADTSEMVTVWDIESEGWRKITKVKVREVEVMEIIKGNDND